MGRTILSTHINIQYIFSVQLISRYFHRLVHCIYGITRNKIQYSNRYCNSDTFVAMSTCCHLASTRGIVPPGKASRVCLKSRDMRTNEIPRLPFSRNSEQDGRFELTAKLFSKQSKCIWRPPITFGTNRCTVRLFNAISNSPILNGLRSYSAKCVHWLSGYVTARARLTTSLATVVRNETMSSVCFGFSSGTVYTFPSCTDQ